MRVETQHEREARGKPVGRPVDYQAMGGLTGFSSLADGYMRLDDSGIGAPSREFLEQPPPRQYEDPFTKAHNELARLSLKDSCEGSKEMTQEERDMAYFEKRYQQRLKAERHSSRVGKK